MTPPLTGEYEYDGGSDALDWRRKSSSSTNGKNSSAALRSPDSNCHAMCVTSATQHVRC